MDKVPVEIWRAIFELVPSISSQSELSLEGESYVFVNSDSRRDFNVTTFEEEAHAARERLTIVQVCKHWFDIGIQALWSHIRIVADFSVYRSVAGIEEAIQRAPTLAKFIVRLTIVPRSTSNGQGLILPRIENIMSQASSFKIFFGPAEYATWMIHEPIHVLIMRGYLRLDQSCKFIEEGTFQNVCVLGIYLWFGMDDNTTWKPVHFPRLYSLQMHANDPLTANYITRYWKMPQLRILSILSVGAADWLPFMEKNGSELRTLEISILNGPDWAREVHFPKLAELHISAKRLVNRRILAPNLEQLCIFSIDASQHHNTRETLIQAVNLVRSGSPALRRLRLSGVPGKDFTAPGESRGNGLTTQDTKLWKEAGVEVDIRCHQA